MPVDYNALAKKAGAISSTPPPSVIDYDALAKKAGAISSTPPEGAQMLAARHQQTLEHMQQDNPYNFTDTSGGGFLDSFLPQASGFIQGIVHLPRGNEVSPVGAFGATEATKDVPVQTIQQATDQTLAGNFSGAAGTVAGFGAGVGAGILAGKAAGKAIQVAPKVVRALPELPARAKAFATTPPNIENFSNSFAAVPTQKPILTNSLDTFKRMGISPAKDLPAMSERVENARTKLSGVYEQVIPFVENRLIPADDVISGLEAEKAQYTRKGIVSPENQPFVAKIDKEIAAAQELAERNGNGKLDFNDVRYLRDGMNGRTDFKSPQADASFYRRIGDVYRGALDKMAPETTGLNRDWANIENAKFVADKNLAMGRGITPSGLDKVINAKNGWRVVSGLAGAGTMGPFGAAAAILPDAIPAAVKFTKSLPERYAAARDLPTPASLVPDHIANPPQPAGLLEAGAVRMPAAADSSGPIPGGPYMGAGISPEIGTRMLPQATTIFAGAVPDPSGPIPGGPYMGAGIAPEVGNRMLPPASQVQTGGFAVGDDLIPVKDPDTGHWVYVPRWTLQENASPLTTSGRAPVSSGTPGAIAKPTPEVARSENGRTLSNPTDSDPGDGEPGGARLVHQPDQPNRPHGAAGERPLSGAQKQAAEQMAKERMPRHGEDLGEVIKLVDRESGAHREARELVEKGENKPAAGEPTKFTKPANYSFPYKYKLIQLETEGAKPLYSLVQAPDISSRWEVFEGNFATGQRPLKAFDSLKEAKAFVSEQSGKPLSGGQKQAAVEMAKAKRKPK
jgi:hypothetical protein